MAIISLFAVHLGVRRSISGSDTKGQAEGWFSINCTQRDFINNVNVDQLCFYIVHIILSEFIDVERFQRTDEGYFTRTVLNCISWPKKHFLSYFKI